MTDDTPDLGDPREVQPGDPQVMDLHGITGAELQTIVAALNELPAKFARSLLDKLEAQRDAAVLEARRKIRAAKAAVDADRLAKAEERRQRRNARHARANGSPPETPAPQ